MEAGGSVIVKQGRAQCQFCKFARNMHHFSDVSSAHHAHMLGGQEGGGGPQHYLREGGEMSHKGIGTSKPKTTTKEIPKLSAHTQHVP